MKRFYDAVRNVPGVVVWLPLVCLMCGLGGSVLGQRRPEVVVVPMLVPLDIEAQDSFSAVDAEVVTVTTTAATVTALWNTAASRSPRATECMIISVPAAGQTVFWGQSDVAAASTANSHSFAILAGQSQSIPTSVGRVFLRVAATTQVVHIATANNC